MNILSKLFKRKQQQSEAPAKTNPQSQNILITVPSAGPGNCFQVRDPDKLASLAAQLAGRGGMTINIALERAYQLNIAARNILIQKEYDFFLPADQMPDWRLIQLCANNKDVN